MEEISIEKHKYAIIRHVKLRDYSVFYGNLTSLSLLKKNHQDMSKFNIEIVDCDIPNKNRQPRLL